MITASEERTGTRRRARLLRQRDRQDANLPEETPGGAPSSDVMITTLPLAAQRLIARRLAAPRLDAPRRASPSSAALDERAGE